MGLNKLASAALFLCASTIVAAENVNYDFNIVNAVLAPDGVERSTVVVNGQFPGPLIKANKGDSVTVSKKIPFFSLSFWIYDQVNAINSLTDPNMRRSTSIHWRKMFSNHNSYVLTYLF